ncbi:7-carboxy-7-deazaguanine synthase QueE [Stieleria varia]|uniref:7-carboxy-7-deazaguanine synthase n=1 Tax=Stieleria varia TaxID=2528005 RepID=A0A5C6A6A1_9BACT|nr:7-carboxy-7-deazaguanine synthase QueE [Stieleria varia]TWT93873.1 7-carboxy-7-deazaguanine synthase [Stieleria varia]
MRVAETFTSRQGEGKLTGVESFFVRTSGCNLRCWFCDTPYASWNPVGESHSIDSLVQQAVQSGCRHVVLTGGEPLLPESCVALTQQFAATGLHLTVETAGTIFRDIAYDLLSLSPKLAASVPDASDHPRWNELHERRRMPIDTMRRLIEVSKAFQVKFVVDSRDEFDEVDEVVRLLQVEPDDVWIMPQGSTNESLDAAASWLTPWAHSQGYRYCDRMQIRWYGNRRGT